jgi:radical SAM protein with 4Fe4S-binding SPASM domain
MIKRLIANALIFRCHKFLNKPVKPTVVSLALTHRCNSHCIMCNIWKRKRELPDLEKLEMSGREIIRLFSRPFFSELVELDLTGGEPFLRNDVVEIATGIAELKNSFLPKLRSIIITSNGLLTDRVVSSYREILENIKNIKVDLVSVSSIDGIGEIHDQIRGTRSAFEKVSATIEGLLQLKNEYDNFFPGIKTTILSLNIDELQGILEFAASRRMFHIISPVFFTAGRFRNTEQKDLLTLSDAEYNRIDEFYRQNKLETGYYYFQARRALESGKKHWICTAAYNYLFIEFDGTVFPCELVAEPVGDLKQDSIEEIWSSQAFRKWRKMNIEREVCRKCIEPGAIRYSAVAEGSCYFRFLAGLSKDEFHKSFEQDGFSKYLH